MSRLVYPDASVILAGDLNMLSDQEITETTGLLPLVHQSPRGNSCLERLYASRNFFTTVRVVTSSVRSDHRTIIANPLILSYLVLLTNESYPYLHKKT